MGNGTKVALVALLILMVVVVAKFVKDDSRKKDSAGSDPGGDPSSAVATPASAQKPSGRREDARERPAERDTRRSANLAVTRRARGSEGAPAAPAAAEAGRPAPGSGREAGATRRLWTGPSSLSSLPPPRFREIDDPAGTAVSMAPPPRGGAAGTLAALPPPPASSRSAAASPEPLATPPGTGTARAALPPRPQGLSAVVRTETVPPGGLAAGRPPVSPPLSVRAEERLQEEAARRASAPPAAAPRGESLPPVETLPPAVLPPAGEGRAPRTTTPARALAGAPAGGGPAPSAEPAASGFPKVHVIQSGESYWALAKRYYGRGSLYQILEKANQGVKFQPGKKITVPPPPAAGSRAASAAPATTAAAPAGEARASRARLLDPGNRTARRSPAPRPAAASPRPTLPTRYLVRAGDTLSGLAKRFYGDPRKFYLIEDANPTLRYTLLPAGARITIPAER